MTTTLATPTTRRPGDPVIDARLSALPRLAIGALHAELVLAPKPGLVSPTDPGSHDDMDATTMMRGIVSLRHGFRSFVATAADGAPFAQLEAIGVAAEDAMARATGGVNTHRGAIFTVGLLAAAAATVVARGDVPDDRVLRATIRERWERALTMRPVTTAKHGRAMASRHGAGGARREAADGFPTVFDRVLPALRHARRQGADERGARLHALMTAIATLDDTNVLYRGGPDGLRDAQAAAREFLAAGGVHRPDCDDRLRAIGRRFVERRLSPGGSADLLAAALFVDRVVAGGPA
jgi:triphosphoribosyl-dephospho-CoA synthase